MDQPYRHLIVNSLNVILGRDQATTSSTLRKSEKRASFVFWTVELREQILAKFGESSLSDQEMTEGYDLRQSIGKETFRRGSFWVDEFVVLQQSLASWR